LARGLQSKLTAMEHSRATGAAPRIVVATTHPEGSFLSIAQAAVRRSQLARLVTTLHTAGWSKVVGLIPARGIRAIAEREVGRRSFPGVPVERVETVGRLPELLHITALRLPGARVFSSRSLFTSYKYFDRAVGRTLPHLPCDAVVCMDASGAATFESARKLGVLTVLNCLDSHPDHQNRLLRETWGLPDDHHELVSPETARRVERELELGDIVLVPSQYVAGQLRQRSIPEARIVIKPFGVDLAAFRPSDVDERLVQKRPLQCLYIGQISHRKGVRVLLHAAQRLRHRAIAFDLVGPLVSPEVLERASDNVRWHGASVYGDIPELMRRADVFVLPSIDDAYGLVVVEAMACGLAIVVTDHAGASEVVTDGVDGIVVPAGDVPGLVVSLERLLDDPEGRLAMGLAARRRVENAHSWEDYGNSVLSTIQDRLQPTH
jgi:glycosyltransferase involved in cell wall biosynthesis